MSAEPDILAEREIERILDLEPSRLAEILSHVQPAILDQAIRIRREREDQERRGAIRARIAAVRDALIEREGLTDVSPLDSLRVAARRGGLPVVIEQCGTEVWLRDAERRIEIGPGPALECLPSGCRLWRPVDRLTPYERCCRWRLKEAP
jgi:hypothetical protein